MNLSKLCLPALLCNCAFGQDSANLQANAEMRKIYEEDQSARSGIKPGSKSATDWATIQKQDAERRAATRKLIDSQHLQTGKDFEYAAFIFQHGGQPDSYLLAHTLAIVAVSKGNVTAQWIAAAALDRYLMAIGKPQVYGTQFQSIGSEPVSQEPYDRDVISDKLRTLIGIPTTVEQEKQLQMMRSLNPRR